MESHPATADLLPRRAGSANASLAVPPSSAGEWVSLCLGGYGNRDGCAALAERRSHEAPFAVALNSREHPVSRPRGAAVAHELEMTTNRRLAAHGKVGYGNPPDILVESLAERDGWLEERKVM